MGFKENLRDEISYQGLMIKELAARAGLNAGSVSNYLKENSSIPSADVAVKIASALNVSVEYLVNGKSHAESEKNILRKSAKWLTNLSPCLPATEKMSAR